MGGPVSSLGEEVGKDSTADGGQRDEQERWDSDLQTPGNSSFGYFTDFDLADFIFYFTEFISQIITGIEPL